MIVDTNLPQKEIVEIETKLGGEYNVESVINDDGTQTLNINYVGSYVGSAGENNFSKFIDGSLTTITEHDLSGIMSFRKYAFAYSTINDITIPNSVYDVNDYTFLNCRSLEKVILPETIKRFGRNAFQGCAVLENIIIPDSVLSIQYQVFANCTSLKEITIEATTPPRLANTNAISTATTTIYIPVGTLEAYSTATNWSSFADKFVEKEM